ncbi:hypothetical protein EON66_08990 [archaeon]|nr:MAG: hypothetical protein EON66_08990 [archaeon]
MSRSILHAFPDRRADMIRSVPANPADSVYCTLLAQSAVHGAMAGYTGFSVGLTNNRLVRLRVRDALHSRRPPRLCFYARAALSSCILAYVQVYLPITAVTANSPRRMNPRGRTYERMISITGQPDPLSDPAVEVEWRKTSAGSGKG